MTAETDIPATGITASGSSPVNREAAAAGPPTSGTAAAFNSILFPAPWAPADTVAMPDYFHDLGLDQIVATVTADWQEYDLVPFFQHRLDDLSAITYRQEVMRELENPGLMQIMRSFAHRMHAMRSLREQTARLHYRYQKARWFLQAADLYGNAVQELLRDLSAVGLTSQGLNAWRTWLAQYVHSDAFEGLIRDTVGLKTALAAIRYSIGIRDSGVTVRHGHDEADYSAVIEEVFAKFRQGAVKDYRARLPTGTGMNHVEARILDGVAHLNRETFAALDDYCERHARYLDDTVARFDREIHFYIAWLSHIDRLRQAGLEFCRPQLSHSKTVGVTGAFDLALADALVKTRTPVVCNDFDLHEPERILVVTGPNHGGKTTFARLFGQLHHLGSLGCPVPGRQARLFLCDRIYSHFEREEDINTLRGKLQDDLVRMHRILSQATERSIVIVNEIFASTTLQDALFLGRKLMTALAELDSLAVCVTFLDELASFNDRTVSLVGTVDPADPAIRTFHIERRPADGLAYAMAIARKYRVTHDDLMARIRP